VDFIQWNCAHATDEEITAIQTDVLQALFFLH
jgi:hypothetical protein